MTEEEYKKQIEEAELKYRGEKLLNKLKRKQKRKPMMVPPMQGES